MKQFIEKYFTIIVFVILLLTFFKGCNDSRKIDRLSREIIELKDSSYTKDDFNLKLKIEGLKSELRMIQSTDRKILDVNRQNEIVKEINLLEDKLK